MSYDLVVMAGGRLEKVKWGECAPATKSLLIYKGKTLLEITLTAFSILEVLVTKIVVTDEPDAAVIARGFGARTIPTGNGLIGNLQNALFEFDSSPATHIIVTTSDIPFLTQEDVLKLYEYFEQYKAAYDFLYPVVSVDLCEALAPGTHRTSIKTSDGRFTGGNIFLVNKTKLKANLSFLKSLVDNRKSPFKLASLIGFITLIQVVTGRGTLERYSELVSRRIDGTVRAFKSEIASIAVDVDSPIEYAKMMSNPTAS